MQPRIALTLGDVAGIGPEIVARAVTESKLRSVCRPIVVGNPEVFRRANALIGTNGSFECISSPAQIDWNSARIPLWDPSNVDASTIPIGQIDASAGQAAYDYLVASAQAALRGEIDAITTAPLNKASLHAAGLNYPGHTEILADQCGVNEFAMMLYLPAGSLVRGTHGLGVAHVTLHTSIRSVPELLNQQHILETIELVDGFLKRVGCHSPRVGVCALNPHGGEGGLFGDEEQTLIRPAVQQACATGINAAGPIPADALLRRAVYGEFDGIAAMYHDQGHIALKLIGFESAVNVTLGLPIVRTSPSHGTAFDIAWQGKARAAGMIGAIECAARLAQQ